METTNPHDKLFKITWSDRETAKSFFRNYLDPELLSQIDLRTLELSPASFVEEELREYRCDLLYRTEIGARPGYIYFLFEHKSHADADVALQLLGYMNRIWGLHRKQQQGSGPFPVIVPLVLYHGAELWSVGDDFLCRFDHPAPCLIRHIQNYRFMLIDLSRFSDEQIRGEVMLRAALMLFKYVFSPDYGNRLPGIFTLLKSLVEKETGMQYIEAVIRYVLSTWEGDDTRRLKQVVEENLAENKGDLVMTIADALFNKGMQQGMQQGIQQGLQQGMQQGMKQGIQQGIREGLFSAIELGLELRFGEQGSKVMQSIRQLSDIERLSAIRDAIRIGASLRDIAEMIGAPDA